MLLRSRPGPWSPPPTLRTPVECYSFQWPSTYERVSLTKCWPLHKLHHIHKLWHTAYASCSGHTMPPKLPLIIMTSSRSAPHIVIAHQTLITPLFFCFQHHNHNTASTTQLNPNTKSLLSSLPVNSTNSNHERNTARLSRRVRP